MLAPAPPEPLALDTSFRIEALADAHVALRLLNFLAQRDLVADRVCMERNGDRLGIEIHVAGLPVEVASILAEKMRALVQVVSVTWDARAA